MQTFNYRYIKEHVGMLFGFTLQFKLTIAWSLALAFGKEFQCTIGKVMLSYFENKHSVQQRHGISKQISCFYELKRLALNFTIVCLIHSCFKTTFLKWYESFESNLNKSKRKLYLFNIISWTALSKNNHKTISIIHINKVPVRLIPSNNGGSSIQ